MPSAVPVLLRRPDNKFFEKPIRERRACRSKTFSHRRLRSAIRRQQACHRRAGRSMEFRRQARFRGDPQDIQRTVEGISTRVLDRKIGIAQRHPHLRPILARRAKSLRSRAATLPAPSAPVRRRLEPAALAQSAGSPTGIQETSGGEEKDPTRRADDDQRKSLACPQELSGAHSKGPSGTLQHTRNNAALEPRMGKMRRVRWRVECGDPISHSSFAGMVHWFIFAQPSPGGSARTRCDDACRPRHATHRRELQSQTHRVPSPCPCRRG